MIGQIISHYKILDKLGVGGMGVVYKAEDTKLKRIVALKFLPLEMTHDTQAKERFLQEARAASALDHPNICTVHEIGETEDHQLFIVMPCYAGQNLKDLLAQGAINVQQVLNFAIQIAEGLHEAHAKSIIHRDIKPANIMITGKGQIKIMDFGLAKLTGRAHLTLTGTTLGTAAYMSPEQALGQEVDQRSDIWSLGVVLYQMLSSQLPFTGDYDQAVIYSIINTDPLPLSEVSPEVPAALDRIVHRTLEKNPDKRYQHMSELLDDLRTVETEPDTSYAIRRSISPNRMRRFLFLLRKPRVLIPAVLVVMVLIASLIFILNHRSKVRWAKDQALPEIERYVNDFNYPAAFSLLKQAEEYIPQDPTLRGLAAYFTYKLTVVTDPPGADVYIRGYSDVNGEWEKQGQTPVESRRIPRFSIYLVKIEKTGYEDLLAVGGIGSDTLYRKLFKKGAIPPGMVYVDTYREVVQYEILKNSCGFFMDRYEVTNKQYKEFVDKGGYRKPEYWKNEFIKDGKKLTWEDALAQLTDKTGRPGPSTWEAGDYPDGQDDYPVTGVSWYEAAAYAEYASKSLPSRDHWSSATVLFYPDDILSIFGSNILTLSNFNGKGPEPVGKCQGVNLFGTYDMAGNVREWCWNETAVGRIISGGGWDDANYLYYDRSQLPPFDRSPENGFRCVQYGDKEKIPASAFRRIDLSGNRDFSKEKPVAENIFRIYKNQFLYDNTDLKAVIEERDESPEDWMIEKVSFTAAYGGERMIAYLYLPKKVETPFQTLVFFPGRYAVWEKDQKQSGETKWFLEYILKSGRAVMYPVYKGTFQRNDGLKAEESIASLTHQYTDWLIKWVKDFRRSVDYLETRPDIDHGKLGYYAHSWGGFMGGIIPAVEERIKISILISGGFNGKAYPEADQINYVSRIKIPVLMLNGKYDAMIPFETSIKLFFDLLGTPEKDKRFCLYETGHYVAKSEMIRETLNWLDHYLGPVP
jgi:serine/threonine protein kinase/dienelactone hydrolase